MFWLQLLCGLLLPVAVLAQSNQINGTFFNPPDQSGDTRDFSQNPVYKIGDTLQVRWQTEFTNISLVLWQDESDTFEYLLPDVPNPNNYNWVISTDKNINNRSLQHPHVFYLSVYNFGSTTDEFNTHYINLTNPATSTTPTTTSTSSTPTSSPTQSLTKPAPAAASTTGAGAGGGSNSGKSDSSGLSSSTKVGLGIGIGVGIPLLVIIGALIGWRLAANRRKRSGSPVQNNVPLMSADVPRSPNGGPAPAGYQDNFQRHDPSPKPADAYNGYYAPAHELPDRFPAGQEVPGSERIFHELPNESTNGR